MAEELGQREKGDSFMLGRSLVIGAMSLSLVTASASVALAAENTGQARPASLPSADSWGSWFKVPYPNATWHKDTRCRLYASVTAGSEIRFRAYAECNHKEHITISVNGLMNGKITKSKSRACTGQNWCDVVYKVNNKKGRQKWCGVASAVTINGYWPGPKVTPRKPCIYY
jgi:hypothetical protein